MCSTNRFLATLFIGVLLTASLFDYARATDQTFLTVGTGDVTGVYYAAGGALCRVINKNHRERGLRCLVESTDGSVYNLKAIRDGWLEMAVVQSDWQYHAYNGTNKFQDQGPFKELRAMLSLHSEPFTVVARAYSGIKTFDDLKGKRVNIGNPGSGQRGTMEVLMQAKGWTRDDFAQTFELNPTDQSEALCNNRVDAIVFTVGHPNTSILKATTACDSVLVEVSGREIDKLVENNPYYSLATIPGGMYRGNPEDVKTFGVRATLVTTISTADDLVYLTAKSVFENFEEFRGLHPALANLRKKSMITDGNSAPLHPGAERYFREAGFLE